MTVNLAGTGTAATLYSDNSFTPQVNPLTSNTDGTYQFYAHNGRYDVVLTKTSFTFTASETTDVLLDDEFSVVSPAQITSNQNNYAPTNGTDVSVWRINSDATRSITGIAAPLANAGQRILTLVNTGSFNINLVNASASSSAGNKFTCANGRDYALFPTDQVQLIYDPSSAVWRTPWQSPRVISKSSTVTTISNDNTERTLLSVTIAGGLLSTGSRLRYILIGKWTNTTGGGENPTVRVKYGGTSMAGATGTTVTGFTNELWRTDSEIVATGATNTQTGAGVVARHTAGTASVIFGQRATGAIDSTVDQTFLVTWQWVTAVGTLSFSTEHQMVEWLP